MPRAFLTATHRRTSPMNLSRSSSSATAKAPESNLGPREEGGSMQANLHRSILRTQARHCCWVTAKHVVTKRPHLGGQPSDATRGEKLMRAKMMSFADVTGVDRPWAQLSGSHDQLTVSESGIDVPLSTANNIALLLLRSSPLRISRAAPRQILRCVHAGNERGISSRGPKTPLLGRTRQHDIKGDNRGSCFVAETARTMARAGGHRDPTPP